MGCGAKVADGLRAGHTWKWTVVRQRVPELSCTPCKAGQAAPSKAGKSQDFSADLYSCFYSQPEN